MKFHLIPPGEIKIIINLANDILYKTQIRENTE